MYYVYILTSQFDGKLYIGYTPDLKSRIKKHNSGYVTSTRNRRPLKLVYYEAFINRIDAKKREIFLKSGKGHDQLKVQLENSYKQIGYKYRY